LPRYQTWFLFAILTLAGTGAAAGQTAPTPGPAQVSASQMLSAYSAPFSVYHFGQISDGDRNADGYVSTESHRMRPIAQSIADRLNAAALFASLTRYGTPDIDTLGTNSGYFSVGAELLLTMSQRAFLNCYGDACGTTGCIENLGHDDLTENGDCLNAVYTTDLVSPQAAWAHYVSNESPQARALLMDPFATFGVPSNNPGQDTADIVIAGNEAMAAWYAQLVDSEPNQEHADLFVYASASQLASSLQVAIAPYHGAANRAPSYALHLFGEFAPLYSYIIARQNNYPHHAIIALQSMWSADCAEMSSSGISPSDAAVCRNP